jgi:hypothetical protein
MTVKLHEATMTPAPFVARQVTVFVPSGKVEPLGGAHRTVEFDEHGPLMAGVG